MSCDHLRMLAHNATRADSSFAFLSFGGKKERKFFFHVWILMLSYKKQCKVLKLTVCLTLVRSLARSLIRADGHYTVWKESYVRYPPSQSTLAQAHTHLNIHRCIHIIAKRAVSSSIRITAHSAKQQKSISFNAYHTPHHWHITTRRIERPNMLKNKHTTH